jgi:hypothetical protein
LKEGHRSLHWYKAQKRPITYKTLDPYNIVVEQTQIDVPRICLYIVSEQYNHKVMYMCGLTP